LEALNHLLVRAVLSGLSAVFLDRDGTINAKAPEGSYVSSPRQLRLLPGAAQAVRLLNDCAVPVYVVTNQRGVARETMTLQDVDAVNIALQRRLARYGARVDAFYVCPHDEGACNCRKPLPGLLLQAAAEHDDLSLVRSVMIGDSEADVGAALAAGALPIRLGRTGTSSRAPIVVADLRAAVASLLEGCSRTTVLAR